MRRNMLPSNFCEHHRRQHHHSGAPNLPHLKPNWLSGRIADRSGRYRRKIADSSSPGGIKNGYSDQKTGIPTRRRVFRPNTVSRRRGYSDQTKTYGKGHSCLGEPLGCLSGEGFWGGFWGKTLGLTPAWVGISAPRSGFPLPGRKMTLSGRDIRFLGSRAGRDFGPPVGIRAGFLLSFN